MDRRRRCRFVPSSEGLEDRQLLSTTAASAPASPAATTTLTNPYATTAPGVQVDGSPASPESIEAKMHRITNLPYFVGLLNRDGVVPQPTTENIQNDLRQLVSSFTPGNSSAVSSFNLDLRASQPYLKIRPVDAENLNRDFGTVLEAAGARPEVVQDLQNQMNDLTAFDTATQENSRIVVTNDYAMILELALGVGRPLIYPAVPTLYGPDHNGNIGKVQVTHNARPSLTGTYSAATNIQIVDVDDKVVLGSAAVDTTTGVYTVKFNQKLTDGIYTVRVRAEDSGFVSDPSPKFTFKVELPVPKATSAPKAPAK